MFWIIFWIIFVLAIFGVAWSLCIVASTADRHLENYYNTYQKKLNKKE